MSYILEKRSADAHSPRSPGSVLLTGQKLGVVYHKYKSTRTFAKNDLTVNLVFAHGTGMNKSMWRYHIERLYELSEKSGGKWNLDAVVAIDAVGHGDSAVLNRGKLGWVCKWDENAKDIIAVLKHEQATTGDFQNNFLSRTIGIGHSYGGYQILLAAHHDPYHFDSIVPIEPVIYGTLASTDRFTRIFKKLTAFILDDFDTQEEFDRYFTEMALFKTWDKRVQSDVLKDELTIEKDAEGELKFRSKTAAFNQIVTYLGAAYSLKLGMGILPFLKVPVLHVVGSKAQWNPPGTVSFIRDAIPSELLDTADIPEGEHLVPGERPDEVIEIIESYIQKRVKSYVDERATFIETQYPNQAEKIKDSQHELIYGGEFTKISGFREFEIISKL